MISFLFKRRKVVVDCFTHMTETLMYAPIKPASKMYPEWWKGLPGSYQNGLSRCSTIKRCLGFVNQYQVGVMVPLWTDFTVEVGAAGSNRMQWDFADGITKAVSHPPMQRGNFLPEHDYAHLKLIAPWVLRTKEFINFAYVSPMWNHTSTEFFMPPAVVDLKYQHGVNVNLFFRRHQDPHIVSIPHGTPMIQIIPLTEREVEFRCHLLSEGEMHNVKGLTNPVTYEGSYRMHKKAMQQYEAEGKCPFKGTL